MLEESFGAGEGTEGDFVRGLVKLRVSGMSLRTADGIV